MLSLLPIQSKTLAAVPTEEHDPWDQGKIMIKHREKRHQRTVESRCISYYGHTSALPQKKKKKKKARNVLAFPTVCLGTIRSLAFRI